MGFYNLPIIRYDRIKKALNICRLFYQRVQLENVILDKRDSGVFGKIFETDGSDIHSLHVEELLLPTENNNTKNKSG